MMWLQRTRYTVSSWSSDTPWLANPLCVLLAIHRQTLELYTLPLPPQTKTKKQLVLVHENCSYDNCKTSLFKKWKHPISTFSDCTFSSHTPHPHPSPDWKFLGNCPSDTLVNHTSLKYLDGSAWICPYGGPQIENSLGILHLVPPPTSLYQMEHFQELFHLVQK